MNPSPIKETIMDMCNYLPLAIRLRERTLSTITALNDGTEPEIRSYPEYFMIYCFGSDHEEMAIIDEETYSRTYEPMPVEIDAMQVNTID
jgi:hypothetical protein